MRLTWSPRTMRSPECSSEYEFWIYKDQSGFACTLSSLSFNNMSNIAKSTTPTVPSAVESKDWTKATTPELQSGSEDEASVLDAKMKERRRRKQVKREEKQRREEAERRAREEAEARAREEAERAKAEAERKAKEEAERQAREQAEKDRAEVQRRAAEVAARQRALAQEASKKRARDEPEAGPSGDRSDNAR